MQVLERIIEIDNPANFKWDRVFALIEKQIQDLKNKSLIKLNLVKTTKTKLYFNVVYINSKNIGVGFFAKGGLTLDGRNEFAKITSKLQQDISCLIIPTGIGAAFGGYAGDANPIAKLLAKKSKYLLTHPNVVNGAVLSDMPPNAIYLDGYFLDQFLLGNINILPNNKNKIGVIFDRAITDERLDYEINVLNALKAFYGCEIIGWTITGKSLNVLPNINEYGFSSGSVENLDDLIEKAVQLKDIGASAIAICAVIPDLDVKGYIEGKGIDPIGGVESIISRAVSSATSLVSAHAPILVSLGQIDYKKISPASASEYIARTFLPSVISGLRYAPQILRSDSKLESNLSFYNLSEIILPYNAFGSPGIFYLNELVGVKERIFLIKENTTCIDVNPNDLNVTFNYVDGYADMVGERLIYESGIDLSILKRPIKKVKSFIKSQITLVN